MRDRLTLCFYCLFDSHQNVEKTSSSLKEKQTFCENNGGAEMNVLSLRLSVTNVPQRAN